MTKHAVRLYIEPPKGNAENAVDNWVQNHTEWTADPQEHTMVETTADIDGDGTTYVFGMYRFEQDTDATSLLDDLEPRLQSFQGGLWYRIGYHVCDHDEDNRGDCSWTGAGSDIRENGTIPEDIPTFV